MLLNVLVRNPFPDFDVILTTFSDQLEEEKKVVQQESGDGAETARGQGEEGSESFDREDDGYCTLASDTFFKEVWIWCLWLYRLID